MVCCRDYPTSAEDYELLEEAGRGVSATVSGHIVLAANVVRQAVLGLSSCYNAGCPGLVHTARGQQDKPMHCSAGLAGALQASQRVCCS